jgi:hypothetical protein
MSDKDKFDDLGARISAEQQRESAEKDAWHLGDYISGSCENCGRQRVCICPNGKHRCEKCNWVPEDQMYCPISNR